MQALLRFITHSRHPRDQNVFEWTEIHKATWQGNHSALSKFIKMHPTRLNEGNIYGVTALHLAVRWNRIKCLDILLSQSHIDVNSFDEDGWTPLHDAARLGRKKCIEMLLGHTDININALDLHGLTPIYLTTREGYTECLQLLLEKNSSSLNFVNFMGSNLLHNLVRYGRSECLDLLLQADINVNFRDEIGNTALHYAALFGRSACLNLLIDKGCADVNAVNLYNITPLICATAKRKSECALKLINSPDIDVNIRDKHRMAAIHFAIDSQDIDVIKELIDKKQARTDIPNENGWICQHEAAAESYIDVLNVLDERNLINMYAGTTNGETVLSFALRRKQVLNFLIKMKDKYGLNILQHAAIQHQDKLFSLLLKHPRKIHKRNKGFFPSNDFNSRYTIKGRYAELQNLYSDLEKQKQVSIFGPAGIGKTAFVKYYAWSHQNLYGNNIFLIDCQTQRHIRKSFINIAKFLHIFTKRYDVDRELTSIVKDVYIEIRKKTSLIIFDNLMDISHITLNLQGTQNIHVVFISRKNIFCDGNITCIQLESVSEAAAVECFDELFHDKILTENNRHHIALLTKIVKCIPLCLITAKLYIMQEYKNIDFKQYLIELKSEQQKLPSIYIKEFVTDESDKIIHSTLIVTLNKHNVYDLIATAIFLDPEHLYVNTLLQLGKIMYPENIFLQKLRHCISNAFMDVVNNKMRINPYVRNLIMFHPYYKVELRKCYRNIFKFLLNGDYSQHHEYVFKCRFDDNFSFFDILLNFRSFEIMKPLVRYSFIKNVTVLFNCMNPNEVIEIVKKYKLLHEAVKSGNMQTVEFIYQFDSNIKSSDEMGHTMIWAAIDKNYTDILNFLISRGASLKHIDKLNKTPLHRAAFLGKTEIVKLLLETGIDPNVRNKFQRTPLHYAAMEGHNDVIEELLKHKDIQIDARDHYRRSPVFETVRCFQIESLKLLIIRGAKINTKDNLDLSPVRLAKLQKHKNELLEVFKEYGFYSETIMETKCNLLCRNWLSTLGKLDT